jgi:hypothetical protein
MDRGLGRVVALAAAAAVVAVVAVAGCRDGEQGGGERGGADDEAVHERVTELAERSGHGDPSGVELPPVPDGAARDWLVGEGAPAAALVTHTRPLLVDDGAEACPAVAGDLDRVGSPEAILTAAAGIPDEVTSELFVDLQAATGRALTACADAEAFDAALADFAWQWALADRRLGDLGVAT